MHGVAPTNSPISKSATPESRGPSRATRKSRASIDVVRFFAGARRSTEGRSAGEYVEGVTSRIRREPEGVSGRSRVEPPVMIAVWNWGAGGGGRQHGGAQWCGGPDVGAAVAAHPHVAIVSFTGSPRAGRAVAHAAGDRYGLYGPEEHTRVRHIARASSSCSGALTWADVRSILDSG